jgi:tRNA (cytidine/uridine-2'-O-)-methyltransferase
VDQAKIIREPSWAAYREATSGRRTILLTTKATTPYIDFRFAPSDILLVGRETSGVPARVHQEVEARLVIPMKPGLRSLNVALACAMATGEALRQSIGFPVPLTARS